MSGKAYTMKEMKDIVEYLTEHKAYSDIKGRKMWVDLASSDVTTRTWQSLKETFLKRILPDIHNPYYNLSVHQLASFKQGCDIEAKLNNKLEIRSADTVSNIEDDNNEATEQAEKEIENDEDIPSGEDLQLKSNTRDSTDTLILENCNQTAEDKKNNLQSANEDDDKEEDAQPKSLRDLITYSEPLNMLQNTIDDFATDEEGSNGEPQMQIVESEEIARKDDNNGDNCVVEILDSDGEKEKTQKLSAKQVKDTVAAPEANNDKSTDTITDIVENESEKHNKSTALFPENHEGNKTNEAEDIPKIDNKSDNQRKSSEITQNTNTISDSLPNNQEAFQNKTKQSSKKDRLSVTKKNRKRANSQEIPQPNDVKKIILSNKKQSISDSDTIALNKDKKKLDPKVIERKLNKIDEGNKPLSNEKSTNTGKTEVSAVNASNLKDHDVDMTASDIGNPCLKSVSLYEEQLSYNKTIESQKDKKVNSTKTQSNDVNDIVILKSHSDSVSDTSKVKTRPTKGKREVTKESRDKAMADVFGFSRGGTNKKRKRTISYKHSSKHHAHHISSGSSEWTSESDSEFISPPRGRKNRQTRKYLKPKAARILSLEDEGGLFVMYGKKIYPIVKDGKIIKSYVTYTPEEEVDPEESYWKLKYVEEKKRTDELTKLLNEVKETPEDDNQVSALAITEKIIPNKQKQIVKAKQDRPDNKTAEAVQNKTDTEDKTIKFKFTKNNEELQLEGHWSHVNPVLAQVMQLLQKDEKKELNDQTSSSNTNENKKKTKTSKEPKNAKQNIPNGNGSKSSLQEPELIESGQTTPINPEVKEDEVKERVSKIESEIFKEIEENELEESAKKKSSKSEEHITKRRGRPNKSPVRTSSSSVSASPSKKIKLDPVRTSSRSVSASPSKKINLDTEPDKNEEITEKNINETSESRKTKSPKKSLNESPKKVRTRVSLSRKSKEVGSPNVNKEKVKKDKIKLTAPLISRKSKTAKAKPKATRYTNSLDCKENSSPPPENRSFCSIDSSRAFQEYNQTEPHKKKNLNRYQANSQLFLTNDVTSESSNSYQSSPLKSMTFQNSTITSDNYSSESYRLLMNNHLSQKHKMFQNLEKIDESPNLNELKSTSEQIYDDIIANDIEMQIDSKKIDGAFKMAHTDEESTSNVSLPTSPVLSIVQNMSVSKDLLSSMDDFPADKLHYSNQIILNNFIKSEPDISMPLMARDCGIETNGHNGGEYHYNISVAKDTPMSETFLNKVNRFNVKDPTLTDTLNTKLKDLMLESTKKTLKGVCGFDQNNNMEDVENMKTKSRKRSSTPIKRKSSRRLTLANNEPCIEEHTESCSYSRKSCPPVVQHFENIDINANITKNISKPKTRQKKDVIKVKITKPKRKSGKERKVDKISEKSISNVIDGSVNDSESGVFLHCFNDSVDLIHNHSETCLNAHDCMGDSVELVKDSKSVIFLDSTTNSEHLLQKHDDNINSIEYELFSNDAQDASELGKEKTASPTVYHSILGSLSQQNSLITEDLSDGSPVKNIKDGNKTGRSTKWYLLSEDETTNTNFMDINQNAVQGLGCGENLNQIFPITCAVPNLSTITEVSTQNENLKKLGNETNSRNCFDSLN